MKGALRHIITVGLWFVTATAFCQCCDFGLVKKDTVLKVSGIHAVDIPKGKQVRIVYEDIPVIVTNREDFTTVGQWTNAVNTNDPFLNKTVSFSNTKDDNLFLNFVGSKVEIVTSTASHHGSMIVQVNQEPSEPISLYSATRKDNVTVYSKIVPAGQNTIRVRVVGNGYVVIDYFKVTQ